MVLRLLTEAIDPEVSATLLSFCDSLRCDAKSLLRSCGDIVEMKEEVDAIMQKLLQNTCTEKIESHAGVSSLLSFDSIPIPTEELYVAAVTKLNSLLHSQALHGSTGANDDRPVIERLIVLLKVIALYHVATSRPQMDKSCDQSSRGSSGCVTPLMRPHRRENGYQERTNIGDRKCLEGEEKVKEVKMAKEAFIVAVGVVTRFSTYGVSMRKEGGPILESFLGNFADRSAEVRMAVLYLLTATLTRFDNALFNTLLYLPALFPEVDPRDPCVVHPLLTPLLWDCERRVRCLASAVVTTLLRKLHHNFKYAEESQKKRQSFSSLASQSGRVLSFLHDIFFWALQLPSKESSGDGVSTVSVGSHISKGVILSSFSVLVRSTPYSRCPHAFDMVQQTFRLPFLREVLLRKGCENFVPATAFLSSVFRAEDPPLAFVVQSYFSSVEAKSNMKPKTAESCTEDGCTDCGAQLLGALLTHAADCVDVWRCVVQLARIHPSIVGAHFDVLMGASCSVFCTILTLIESDQGINIRTNNVTKKNVEIASATLKECLRAWFHFMGYVWQSFDGCPGDPALRRENIAHRANLLQNSRIVDELVLPVLALTSNSCLILADTRQAALRCMAQLGEEYLSSLSVAKLEEMIEQVIASATAYDSALRAEVFTTMGVWAWQYKVFDKWLPGFVERAVCALYEDPDSAVRSKAAFALSNITSGLEEGVETGALRSSSHHMQLLCDVAIHATQEHENPVVVSHGIRMISHLLRILSFEELIDELPGGLVGVAEGYLDALLYFFLPSNRDAKLRWNAACAFGFGLSRQVVFEAEPQGATRAVERLCVVLCHDRIYKVRAQAATALARIPMACLASGLYAPEDLTPKVTRALCEALLASSGSTENYTQYREQGALCAALRQALGVMITSAAPSAMLQRIFAEYRTLLEKEGLL